MRRWVLIGALLLAAPIIASLPLLSVTAPRDTSQEVLLRITADGVLELWQGPDEHSQARLPFEVPGFVLGDEAGSGRSVALLRARLRELTDAAERLDTDVSRLTLRIESAPRTPTRFVTWAIIVGAEPDIVISNYRLSTRGRLESTALTLPSDRRPQIELTTVEMAILVDMDLVEEGRSLRLTISSVDDIELQDEERLPWGSEGPRTIESMVAADGTPLGLAGVVHELERLRALVQDQPEVIVRIASPEPDVVVPARAMIDLMAAVNSVADVDLQLEGRLLPPAVPTGR